MVYCSIKAWFEVFGLFFLSVHTTLKEFENGGSTLNTRQMFSVHTMPRGIEKTQQSAAILELYLRKTRSGKSYDFVTSSFSIRSVFKMHSVHTKTKNWRFQTCPVRRAFPKAPFSWRMSVDGWPNRRNKLRFQIPPAQCGQGLSSCSTFLNQEAVAEKQFVLQVCVV